MTIRSRRRRTQNKGRFASPIQAQAQVWHQSACFRTEPPPRLDANETSATRKEPTTAPAKKQQVATKNKHQEVTAEDKKDAARRQTNRHRSLNVVLITRGDGTRHMSNSYLFELDRESRPYGSSRSVSTIRYFFWE